VQTPLAANIDAARRGGVVHKSSTQQVIVDTTVMPKAIAHPTDSRLLDKSRQHRVKAAKEHGLRLRQNYSRVAPRLAAQIGRYAHAKQFKRMRRANIL
jgi:IS5 family transposase